MAEELKEGGLTVRAPAKINLVLRVIGRRADGFHDIYSVMQPVSLYDTIEIRAAEGRGITVETDSVEAPGGRENLAYWAAELFFRESGRDPGVFISISKRIPVGAGLGGGSSDAASVLMALNEVFSGGLADERLMELGALLGSDVPFFIHKGSAIATGRGEVLRPVPLPGYGYILLNPGFHVSTAWVYGNLNLTKSDENYNLTYSVEALGDVRRLKSLLRNDLEEVTAKRHPEVLELKKILLDSGAEAALMSGSGPTVFGLFKDPGAAEEAFGRLDRALEEGVRRFLVRGL